MNSLNLVIGCVALLLTTRTAWGQSGEGCDNVGGDDEDDCCFDGFFYSFVRKDCLDACSSGSVNCDQNCVDDQDNGATCTCNAGYSLLPDGINCENIDECALGSSGCQQDCTDNIGSFTCSCFTGFTLNADQRNCDDVNECDTNNGGCEETCTNSEGSFECSCPAGQSLTGDGLTCDEVNECADPTLNNCLEVFNEVCVNTDAGFECACAVGYSRISSGTSCTDVDECSSGTDTCDTSRSLCINTIGSFRCRCFTGYVQTITGACEDFNECTINRGDCQKVCVNTIGSFRCDCPPGETLSLNGRTCLSSSISGIFTFPLSTPFFGLFEPAVSDINSPSGVALTSTLDGFIGTTMENRDVNVSSVEVNSVRLGSLIVGLTIFYGNLEDVQVISATPQILAEEIRTSGLELLNVTFNETTEITVEYFDPVTGQTENATISDACTLLTLIDPCGSGYNCTEDNMGIPACTDINECLDNNGGCSDVCTNTNGSYECGCSGQFESLLADNVTCDRDECLDGTNTCDAVKEVCSNEAGSFLCECGNGYAGTAGFCVDVDECGTSDDCNDVNQTCVNTAGSFNCVCRDGFLNSTSGDELCTDVEECEENNGGCDYQCVNTIGSFACVCPAMIVTAGPGESCDDYRLLDVDVVLDGLATAADTDTLKTYVTNTVSGWLLAAGVIAQYVESSAFIDVLSCAQTTSAVTAKVRLTLKTTVDLNAYATIARLMDNQLYTYLQDNSATSSFSGAAALNFVDNQGNLLSLPLGSTNYLDNCEVLTGLAESCQTSGDTCRVELYRRDACRSLETETDEIVVLSVIGSIVGLLLLTFIIIAIYYLNHRKTYSAISPTSYGRSLYSSRSRTQLRPQPTAPYMGNYNYGQYGGYYGGYRQPKSRYTRNNERSNRNRPESMYSSSTGRIWRRIYTPDY